jgi:hypothetical protein
MWDDLTFLGVAMRGRKRAKRASRILFYFFALHLMHTDSTITVIFSPTIELFLKVTDRIFAYALCILCNDNFFFVTMALLNTVKLEKVVK